MAGSVKLPKGAGAWTYRLPDHSIKLVREFNEHASGASKLRYIFAWQEPGKIDRSARNIVLNYDKKTTAKYKTALPGPAVYANITIRNDNGEFNGWTATEYRKAATRLAKTLADDRSIEGVCLDIEPWDNTHMPFYKAMTNLLNATNKVCIAHILNSHPEAVWKAMFTSVNAVCGNGHETTGKDVEKTLTAIMRQRVAWAKATNGKLMMGVYVLGGGDLTTPEAKVAKSFTDHPQFIGPVFFSFVSTRRPKKHVWAQLLKY